MSGSSCVRLTYYERESRYSVACLKGRNVYIVEYKNVLAAKYGGV